MLFFNDCGVGHWIDIKLEPAMKVVMEEGVEVEGFMLGKGSNISFLICEIE